MQMQLKETNLKDVYIIEPRVFGDHRGWFTETWSKKDFEAAGLYYDFVQDNHSFSAKKGTLRGLHFQRGEASQAKLVRCVKGAILDVAVDLRHESPTYKQWTSVELTADNHLQFMIPRGFAHGFVTLTDDAITITILRQRHRYVTTIPSWGSTGASGTAKSRCLRQRMRQRLILKIMGYFFSGGEKCRISGIFRFGALLIFLLFL